MDRYAGVPVVHSGVKVWNHIGQATGAAAISLRILQFAVGMSPGLRTGATGDVMYVVNGRATIFIDGWSYRIGTNTGIYLAPGTVLTVENLGPEPLLVTSSRCPDPQTDLDVVASLTQPHPESTRPQPAPVVSLAARPRETTADRWYKVLIGKQHGSTEVTQFVGGIPPGRAPDHYHHYEEVLYFLAGEGRMWAGETHTPIAAGSCVFLPRQQIHCVENTGTGELRLLGVFYPAGSPAVRYDAD